MLFQTCTTSSSDLVSVVQLGHVMWLILNMQKYEWDLKHIREDFQ